MAEVFTLGLGCLEYIGADLGIHLPTDAGPDTRRGPHAGRQGPGAEKGGSIDVSTDAGPQCRLPGPGEKEVWPVARTRRQSTDSDIRVHMLVEGPHAGYQT